MKWTLVFGMLLGCSGVDSPPPEIIRQAACPPDPGEGDGCPCGGSPVIIDIAGDGVHLTDPEHGVSFSLMPGGYKKYAWTEAGTDDAWLALDRDGDGEIINGSELFGTFTPQDEPGAGEYKNGFAGLRQLDEDGNGQVDAGDSKFAALRLWQDRNHDGRSQPDELLTLASVGITGLSVNYITTDWKSNDNIDVHGNLFVYTSPGATVGMRAWDVYLASIRDPFIVSAEKVGAMELVLGMLPLNKPTPNVPCWKCTARCPLRAKPGSGWQDSQCWYANGGQHYIDAIGPTVKTYDSSTACLAAINVCKDSVSAPTTCEVYGSGCPPPDIIGGANCHTVTCPACARA